MPFDPDKYLATKAQFDPDQYLKRAGVPQNPEEAPEAPPAQISPMESAALGAGNGALAGLGKPLLAGVQTAVDKLGGSSQPIGQLYNQNSELAGEALGQAQKQNPMAFDASQVVGQVASPINKYAAAAGAIQGGVQGYQAGGIPGAVAGTAIGGAVGKGLGLAGNVAAKAVNQTAIYAKPLTDAIQQESAVVAPSFAKAAAKLLTGQPAAAAQQVMAKSAGGIAKLLQTSPEKFGRYAPVLQRAAQSGTLPVTSYILSQASPEFRQHLENAQGDDDGQ